MISPAGVAVWIAGRFDVPAVPARKCQPIRPRGRVGNQVRPRGSYQKPTNPSLGSAEACRQAATARLPPTPKVPVALRPPAQNDRESEIVSGRSGKPARKNMPERMWTRGVLPPHSSCCTRKATCPCMGTEVVGQQWRAAVPLYRGERVQAARSDEFGVDSLEWENTVVHTRRLLSAVLIGMKARPLGRNSGCEVLPTTSLAPQKLGPSGIPNIRNRL
jgi:hypothetical protein